MNNMLGFFSEIYNRLTVGRDNVNRSAVQSCISDKMAREIQAAADLYANNIKNIEWLKNGNVKSLRLPSVICKEISRVATSEFDITVQGNNPRAVFLGNMCQNITTNIATWTERCAAFGNTVFKPFVYNNIVYIKPCRIGEYIPLRYEDDGTLSSVVFVANICRSNQWYTRLEYHHIEDGIYTIENSAYMSTSDNGSLGGAVSLETVPEWADIQPIVQIEGDITPLYGVYKNPFANNVDIDSKLGVSLYAECFDLFKEADELWENIWYEMRSGERKIFAPPGAYRQIGAQYRTSRFYKELDMENEMFQEFSPVFRNTAYSYRLQEIFKRIEENCGISYGTISDPVTVDRTATEVKHSKERMQATINGIQNALQYALTDTITAADKVCDLYNLTPTGAYSLVFNWDDSVIESRQEKADRAMMEYQMGLIDEADYFVQTRGMTREEAEAFFANMNKDGGRPKKGVWYNDEGKQSPAPPIPEAAEE